MIPRMIRRQRSTSAAVVKNVVHTSVDNVSITKTWVTTNTSMDRDIPNLRS
jgi:hypothetical protein